MSADFTTWDRATLEQFAREARDKLVAVAQVEQQRDEMLAILQSMFNEHGDFEYEIGTLMKARAAIAKAKGGAA